MCVFLIKTVKKRALNNVSHFIKITPGKALLTGSNLEDALNEIFERITQDIFNKSLANW